MQSICELNHKVFELAGLNAVQGLDISILRVLYIIYINKFEDKQVTLLFLFCQLLDMSNFTIGETSSSFRVKREEELRSYSLLTSTHPSLRFLSVFFTSLNPTLPLPELFFLIEILVFITDIHDRNDKLVFVTEIKDRYQDGYS